MRANHYHWFNLNWTVKFFFYFLRLKFLDISIIFFNIQFFFQSCRYKNIKVFSLCSTLNNKGVFIFVTAIILFYCGFMLAWNQLINHIFFLFAKTFRFELTISPSRSFLTHFKVVRYIREDLTFIRCFASDSFWSIAALNFIPYSHFDAKICLFK